MKEEMNYLDDKNMTFLELKIITSKKLVQYGTIIFLA